MFSSMSSADRIFTIIGIILLIAALLLTIYNMLDGRRAENVNQEVVDKIHETAAPLDSPVLNDSMGILKPVMLEGRDYVGLLTIPSLNRELAVQESCNDENLREGPCVYSGDPYSGDMVIAAHNYKNIFGGIYRLTPGSMIEFHDMRGNSFSYEVCCTEEIQPDDISAMTESGYDLTLFTCSAGGSKRLAVRCALKHIGTFSSSCSKGQA